ncbi:hypothetical protein CCHL11_01560 [Colletotrichum chlorophyti]|uniref:Uncharacterized protein n=1 Tax=Colletotrichum chlorophyti TaxID=708187 RepID=A0A1Q8RYA4_9PEZI|nr:hypothetical protein CCHL11_01560 [Colletotrichum chlorophyti]
MSANGSGPGYSYNLADYPSSDHWSVPHSSSRTYSVSGGSSTSYGSVSEQSFGGSSQGSYSYASGTERRNDEFHMPRIYSQSAAPSLQTAVSGFGRGIVQQEFGIPPSRTMLECEFKHWTGCQHSFRLDEVEPWIRHAENDHLRGRFPSMCVCWFCDDFYFSTQNCPDPGLNFTHRMQHIAGHMLDGYRFEQRRPDFHFLDHVYNLGEISFGTFQRATTGTSEGPSTPNVYALGWRPASPEVPTQVEVAGRNRRRHNRHHH